ncbi:regulator of sigma E protease [Lachnospiraceae bacterium NK3A20]|jgi:regulator of sigma E protease|nr:regulator of sigma E protease [Lachnospiraceae bacterium NK3A20]
MIVSIILFFIIFSIIVIGHEFGHYCIARRNGIRVNEFDIGFGPTLLQWRRGETDFCVKMLPLGGACIFDGASGLDDTEHELDEHSFPNASVSSRIATVLAGPVANFIIGFVFALFIVAFSGTDLPVVADIMDGGAAQEAGIQAGDTIRKINGESIHLYREVQLFSLVNYGEPLDIVYERNGERHEVTLTPKFDEEAGRYYIGIIGSGEYMRCNAPEVFQYGFYEAQYWVRATLKSLGLIFRGHFRMDDLSGPVGVVKVVDDTYTSAKPYGLPAVVLSMLNLATLLSINLGIMNLLPIPALDGGRLLIYIVEAIRGRKLSAEKEGYITLAGALALIALMAVVMFNDFTKFFR